MFNAPTRAAAQTNLATYGDAFAGRGANLNNTISNLAPALANLEPLARTLAAPGTHLAGFFNALERASADVAPVAAQQGEAFVALDTTFRALASVAPAIGQATDDGPASLDQATFSLVNERPFIAKTTRFFALLAPGAVALRAAAPALAPAVAAGARNLEPATALNRELGVTLAALQSFAQDPGVTEGLQDLTLTVSGAEPIVADLAPMQTVCNYPTLFFRNFANALSEGDGIGNWLRALPLQPQTLYNPSSSPTGLRAGRRRAAQLRGRPGVGAGQPDGQPRDRAAAEEHRRGSDPGQRAGTAPRPPWRRRRRPPTCTRIRTRSSRRPASRRGYARRATRCTPPGQTVIGNVYPNVTHNRDFTTSG